MKAFSLSTTSRPYRILKAMDIHLRGETTFCDVVTEIVKAIAICLFSIAVIAALLSPIANMFVWVVAMTLTGKWITPLTWCAAACIAYIGLVCFVFLSVQYLNWRDNRRARLRKLVNIEVKQKDGTYVPLVKPRRSISSLFCRAFKIDKTKVLHQYIASLYAHSDLHKLTWCSVIPRVIGSILLILVALICCIAFLYPIGMLLAAIAFLILHHGETLHLGGEVIAWIIDLLFVLWHFVPIGFNKLKRAAQREDSFTGNLWNSFKNKTCVKIEIVD